MASTETNDQTRISGILLAAGNSRRMGCSKLLLPYHGRPLLQHALDAAAASCLDEIVLVLGKGARQVLEAIDLPDATPVRVAINEEPASGQSASLRRGLRATDPRAAAAAILLGDQPQMTSARIDQGATAFETDGKAVVRPVYFGPHGDRVPGHPVLVARRVWPEVEKLSGDKGMRSLLARKPEWLRELPLDGEPPGDIDSWQDYWEAANPVGSRE